MTTPLHCTFCGEPFDDPRDFRVIMAGGTQAAHQACCLRSIIGGVNHLRGTCTCCGGDDPPDPPGITMRQAARLALDEYWKAHS